MKQNILCAVKKKLLSVSNIYSLQTDSVCTQREDLQSSGISSAYQKHTEVSAGMWRGKVSVRGENTKNRAEHQFTFNPTSKEKKRRSGLPISAQ